MQTEQVRQLLDPEIAQILDQFPLDLTPRSLEDIPRIRGQRELNNVEIPLSDAVQRTNHVVPADPPVTLRVHRPADASGDLPCIYWMHGGGYMFGSYAMEDLRFDRWCTRLGCVGVSVEYRLAPEHPYPAALDDCYAGLRWVYDNAAQLEVDTSRLGIGGASAGGGLAAALALLARDRGEIPVSFQLLVYPMIDDRQATASSSWEVPIWPPSANTVGWRAYLGEQYGADVPPYAAAARARDLTHLPPALIMVGSLDGFADEDVEYARRLNESGVPAELHVYPGAPHGFDSITPGTRVARRARAHMLEWLETVMAPAPAATP